MAESSSVLLRFSGARPLSSNAFSNILPETTIDKYWSEAVKFNARQDATVLANNLKYYQPNLFYGYTNAKLGQHLQ